MSHSRLPVSLPNQWFAKWFEAKDGTPARSLYNDRRNVARMLCANVSCWGSVVLMSLFHLGIFQGGDLASFVLLLNLMVGMCYFGHPDHKDIFWPSSDFVCFNQRTALFLKLLFRKKRLPLVGYVLSVTEQIRLERERVLNLLLAERNTLELMILKLEEQSTRAHGLLPASSNSVLGSPPEEWELILFSTQKSIEDHRASLDDTKERDKALVAQTQYVIRCLEDLITRIKLAQEIDLLPLGVVDVGKTEECWRKIEVELESLVRQVNLELCQALAPRPLDFLSATPSRPALPVPIRRVK